MNKRMDRVRRKAVAGDGRDRSKKASKPVFDRFMEAPAGLVAKNPPPQPKIKHQSYFEFVENTNKKKPLEYQITVDRNPPPGFTFVPIGNPELTTCCKELSREKNAMIFMVSTSRDNTNELAMHTSRVGHHIREAIVEEARASLGHRHDMQDPASNGIPERIPDTQEEINAQADGAIRELFPRVPNTDRQEIIDHAFKKGATFHGDPVVGMSQDISLSRRVQLAVLAHIRHRHTRYDALLRETSWQHARKTVEAVCLDMIVKWRGDEENGRDTLDSLLREVVVISDSEGDDESDEDSDDLVIVSPRTGALGHIDAGTRAVSGAIVPANLGPSDPRRNGPTATGRPGIPKTPMAPGRAKRFGKSLRRERKAAKKATRGFQRYRAAWEDAVDRNRDGQEATGPQAQPSRDPAIQGSSGNGPHATRRPGPSSPARPTYRTGHAHSSSDVIYLGPAIRAETTNLEPVRVSGQYRTDLPYDAQATRLPVHPQVGAERAPVMTPKLTSPSHTGRRTPGTQYRDLLVPSIEAPPSVSMAPQFIRSLPSRKRPRDEDPDYLPRHPQPQTYLPPVSSAEAVRDGHFKRRRVISDHDGLTAPPSELYPSNPSQLHQGQIRREPETRQPISYPLMDPPRTARDLGTREGNYERRPERPEQLQRPLIERQPDGITGRAGNMLDYHRGVQEPPYYQDHHHPEPMSGQAQQYWGARAPIHHLDRQGQSSLPHYTGNHYPTARNDAHQPQKPSAQPIFVRTLEPRTVGVQVRGGAHDRRYGPPRNTPPPNRWEEQAATRTEYPVRRRSPELFYEINRQPAPAPVQHGAPPVRPYIQDPARLHPRQQQARPYILPYAGHNRPLPPRNIIVID